MWTAFELPDWSFKKKYYNKTEFQHLLMKTYYNLKLNKIVSSILLWFKNIINRFKNIINQTYFQTEFALPLRVTGLYLKKKLCWEIVKKFWKNSLKRKFKNNTVLKFVTFSRRKFYLRKIIPWASKGRLNHKNSNMMRV